MRCLLVVVMVVANAGCLFLPNVEQFGYVACTTNDDCEPGRSCGEGVCAPPPWNDETFGDRRVVLLENQDSAAMPAGTAVPVVIGAGGDLALDDVGPDLRFTDFNVGAGTWGVVPVYLDREQDRFTAWIPTQRAIAQGKKDVLAWIESDTFDKLPTVVENPEDTFLAFDAFEADALDEEVWRITATAGTPAVSGGLVNVADNQSIVLRLAITPPVSVTFVARVNAVTCDEVFLGLIGNDASRFPVGPGVGVFVQTDLNGSVLLAPSPESTPTPVADLDVSTAFTRYTVSADTNAVRVLIDGELIHEDLDLRPPFSDGPMYVAIQVGGACSVDVDAMWATPLPLPAPALTPGPLVQFKLFD